MLQSPSDCLKLTDCFKQSSLESFHKGDLILRPDHAPLYLYYLEKGFIKMYGLTEWGEEKLFVIYKAGDIFPLFYTFDEKPLTKYYEALTSVSIRRVHKHIFLKTITSHQELLFELMWKVTSILETYITRIDCLEFIKTEDRIICYLLFLAREYGKNRETKVIISVPLTHHDIASALAMSRETASRILEHLIKHQLISIHRHRVLIHDMLRLQSHMQSHSIRQINTTYMK